MWFAYVLFRRSVYTLHIVVIELVLLLCLLTSVQANFVLVVPFDLSEVTSY